MGPGAYLLPMNLVQQGVIRPASEDAPAPEVAAKDNSKLIMWSIIAVGGLAVVGTGIYLARKSGKRR